MITKTDYFYKILYAISWVLFIGLCIEAGGFLFSTFFILWINPDAIEKVWMGPKLAELFRYNQTYYVIIASLMIIVAVLKAVLFYIIVKNFHDKKINLERPFNETIKKLVLNIAYLALGIGIFSFLGSKYTTEFMKQGIKLPDLHELRLGGADVWLFMGITLLAIAQIFKKGIEIQNENDLTV